MGKVFVDIGMSLDGFIAGPNGVLLGTGVKAFDDPGPQHATLERLGVIDSPLVTHLSYRVTRKS